VKYNTIFVVGDGGGGAFIVIIITRYSPAKNASVDMNWKQWKGAFNIERLMNLADWQFLPAKLIKVKWFLMLKLVTDNNIWNHICKEWKIFQTRVAKRIRLQTSTLFV